MYGVEALPRWHHPDLGVLTPDKFIERAAQKFRRFDVQTMITPMGSRRAAETDVFIFLRSRLVYPIVTLARAFRQPKPDIWFVMQCAYDAWKKEDICN